MGKIDRRFENNTEPSLDANTSFHEAVRFWQNLHSGKSAIQAANSVGITELDALRVQLGILHPDARKVAMVRAWTNPVEH